MATREQDATIERLALKWNRRLLVRDYYADEHIEIETEPAPFPFRCLITPNGEVEKAPGGFVSPDWWRADD